MEATYHFGPNAGMSGGIGRPQPDIRACGPLSRSRTPDLAILSKDPLAIDPMTIGQIEVIETIKEGKTVFSSASLSATARHGGFTRHDAQRVASCTPGTARPHSFILV